MMLRTQLHNADPVDLSRWLIKIACIVVVALIAANFLSGLQGGLTPDEQVYMEMTKEMALGHPLYQTYVDHQPPGIAIANVPFVWLFGYTTLAANAGIAVYDL